MTHPNKEKKTIKYLKREEKTKEGNKTRQYIQDIAQNKPENYGDFLF